MPTLIVHTNRALTDAVESSFIQTASKEVAALLGKEERWVMIILKSGQPMSFAGDSTTPCAYVEFTSIDSFTPETTPDISAGICSLLEEHLSVEGTRVYIKFCEQEPWTIGYNSSTF